MKKALSILFMQLSLPLIVFCQWSDDYLQNTGIAAVTGEQTLPKIAIDNDGSVYITYFNSSSGNYDVSLAYLDKDGYRIWPVPLTVSNHTQDTWISDYDTKIDNPGNCVTVFSDIRNGNPDPYIYKISPAGAKLWGDDGKMVSNDARAEYSPVLCVTSENNVIVAFTRINEKGQDPLVMVAFDADGNKLWPDGGEIVLTPDGDYSYTRPSLVPSTDGDFIIEFSRSWGNQLYPNRYLYAQRYHINATPAWDNEAVLSDLGGVSSWAELEVKPDGYGGILAAWHDDRDNDMAYSAFVQYIGDDGIAVFEPNGVELSLKANDHKFYPSISGFDGSGNLVLTWLQTDYNQNNAGLYAQKLSGAGERLWTDNGKVIIPIGPSFADLIGSDVENDTIYIVYDIFGQNSIDDRIKATSLDKNGDFVWPGQHVMISDVPKQVIHSYMSVFYGHQWILAWSDTRDDGGDIYAQNLNTDGTIGINGVGIGENSAGDLRIYPNPSDGIINIEQNGGERIVLYDQMGQVVLEKECTGQSMQLDLDGVKPGLYLLMLSNGNFYSNKLMIIE
jgi:hypothetical protein